MGKYTVIADVGNSIVSLLREKMVPEPISQPEYIGLASPSDKGDYMLTLFLYHIEESGDFRNNVVEADRAGVLRYPPMSINLSYLITAHSTSELSSRALDEQRILGKAMQVLFDNSILRGGDLKGTLQENNEEIKIVVDNVPFDVLIKSWNFPSMPYKLSLSYTVGPVYIDSTRIKATKKVLEFDTTIKG